MSINIWGNIMDVSDFCIKISGPYIEKLKIAFRLFLSSFWLATNHDVTVVLSKSHIKSCKIDQ
jgi:hypothetical protein